MADGTVLVWEVSTEMLHTGGPPIRNVWHVTPDAGAEDRVRARFREHWSEDPSALSALLAVSEMSGHRDYLTETSFQHK